MIISRFDRLFTADRLSVDAFLAFARSGRFTTVTLAEPPDIIHSTCPVPLRMAKSRNVHTVHDLGPLKLPCTTLDDKKRYGRLVKQCLREAARICTVSEASRRDIVDWYGVSSTHLTNTYQTAPQVAPPISDDPDETAPVVEGIVGMRARGYFLYFDAIKFRKNVGRLIDAFLRLRTDTPLVVVGAKFRQSGRELRLYRRWPRRRQRFALSAGKR